MSSNIDKKIVSHFGDANPKELYNIRDWHFAITKYINCIDYFDDPSLIQYDYLLLGESADVLRRTRLNPEIFRNVMFRRLYDMLIDCGFRDEMIYSQSFKNYSLTDVLCYYYLVENVLDDFIEYQPCRKSTMAIIVMYGDLVRFFADVSKGIVCSNKVIVNMYKPHEDQSIVEETVRGFYDNRYSISQFKHDDDFDYMEKAIYGGLKVFDIPWDNIMPKFNKPNKCKELYSVLIRLAPNVGSGINTNPFFVKSNTKQLVVPKAYKVKTSYSISYIKHKNPCFKKPGYGIITVDDVSIYNTFADVVKLVNEQNEISSFNKIFKFDLANAFNCVTYEELVKAINWRELFISDYDNGGSKIPIKPDEKSFGNAFGSRLCINTTSSFALLQYYIVSTFKNIFKVERRVSYKDIVIVTFVDDILILSKSGSLIEAVMQSFDSAIRKNGLMINHLKFKMYNKIDDITFTKRYLKDGLHVTEPRPVTDTTPSWFKKSNPLNGGYSFKKKKSKVNEPISDSSSDSSSYSDSDSDSSLVSDSNKTIISNIESKGKTNDIKTNKKPKDNKTNKKSKADARSKGSSLIQSFINAIGKPFRWNK